MLSGRARREQLLKDLCVSLITILILTHFKEKYLAHNTVIVDGSLPSPCILHPILPPFLFYLCVLLIFSPNFLFVFLPLHFHSILSTPSSHLLFHHVSLSLSLPSTSFSFPTTSLIVSFFANLSLSFSLCLSFSGLVLQCSWCWQWNTLTHQTLTLLMRLALARCHTLQLSDATCQVVHQKVEDAEN